MASTRKASPSTREVIERVGVEHASGTETHIAFQSD